MISCGAALHHLQVAALAHGWIASVSRLPDPADPTLLADVRLTAGNRTKAASEDLRALRERCTDRRRFTSWPMPDERLVLLANVATEWGGQAVALTDVAERFQVELLVARAVHLQAQDLAVVEEQRDLLVTSGTHDPADDVQGGDGLVVLCANDDTPLAWLECGEGLSALWLRAVREGLSVVPLSQAIDVPETRAALQYGAALGGLVVPMLLVRVGWQAISRSQLEPTPRRPVEDVLLT
jgi:hypothetical protein